MKKRFYETKGFAAAAILFGLLGLLLNAHHIVSYENILRPYMDYLIENKVLTNDISGVTFLYYFTNQSNIFVYIFLILYAFGNFGNKAFYRITHNEKLRGALTLYICITGVIYCTVMLPFSSGGFPMEKGIWFSNVVNIWNHVIVPLCFTAFWFFPLNSQKIPVVKTSLMFLIYPLGYFIFSVVRGAYTDFYPYPFLSSKQIWSLLFANKPYQSVQALLLLITVVIVLCAVFFGVGCALCAVHNKIVQKRATGLIDESVSSNVTTTEH